MGTISTDRIAYFNPFLKDCFECPICGSKEFAYLAPYGGVWCTKCNANFTVSGTCDGQAKVSIRCHFDYSYNKDVREMFDRISTVVWADDTEIKWLFIKGKEITFKNPFKAMAPW